MDAETARAIKRLQDEVTMLRRRVVKLEELIAEFGLPEPGLPLVEPQSGQ